MVSAISNGRLVNSAGRRLSTMDTNTSSTSGSYQPRSSDPEKELESKKLDLQKVQAELTNGTQKANSLQADIEALQAKIAEMKQLLAAYGAQKLQRELDDENKVITTKIGIAEAALKDKKTAIDYAIKAFDDKLNN